MIAGVRKVAAINGLGASNKIMRNLVLPALLALFAVYGAAQTPAPTPTPAAAVTEAASWLPPATGTPDKSEQKARAVLTQMIEALGGKAYMESRDSVQTGRTYGFENGRPASVGMQYQRFTLFPDKERTEFSDKKDLELGIATIPAGVNKGFYVLIGNGDKGYEISYKGTALQEPERWREFLKQRKHSLPWVLRIWLKKPGAILLYEGTAIAQQRMCDKVSIISTDNDAVTLFVDQITHLPLKKTFTVRNPLDNLKDEEAEVYGNYRLIQGIQTPHSITTSHNGEYTVQRFIQTVTYNSGVHESLFEATPTYDPYALERRLDEQRQQQLKKK